jgi:hypothetical protein
MMVCSVCSICETRLVTCFSITVVWVEITDCSYFSVSTFYLITLICSSVSLEILVA